MLWVLASPRAQTGIGTESRGPGLSFGGSGVLSTPFYMALFFSNQVGEIMRLGWLQMKLSLDQKIVVSLLVFLIICLLLFWVLLEKPIPAPDGAKDARNLQSIRDHFTWTSTAYDVL